MNIAMLLEMVAEGDPDRIVVGSRTGGLRAAELLERARAFARRIVDGTSERVGLVDLNSEAVPLALFGAGLAGLPFAPVNYRLTDEQLDAILRRLAPGVVVVGPETAARVQAVDGLRVIARDELLAPGTSADDAVAGGAAELPFVDAEEIAVLLFTSGTTGDPKAAVLRHRHLTSYIIGSVEFLGA